MATQATLVYTVNVPFASTSAMEAFFSAAGNVPLDLTPLLQLGVTVTSDATSAGANPVARTIVIALNQPPVISANNPPLLPFLAPPPPSKYNWTGSIFSTSAQDAPGGAGAQTLTVSYADKTGALHTNVGVNLNGLAPVALPTADHSTITGVTLTAVGALGANRGQLVFLADPIPGFPENTISQPATTQKPPPFPGAPKPGGPHRGLPAPVVAVVPPSFFASLPNGGVADQKAPFRNLWTALFSMKLACPVIAAEPVLA